MKRKTVHGIFAALLTSLILLALWQAIDVYKALQLSATLDKIPTSIQKPQDNAHLNQPHIMLAKAQALSNGGQFDAAELLLVRLIDQQKNQPLGQAARFNLANHYLRKARASNTHGAQARPLIEIAKQRYRDILKTTPYDWDARYNLEIALRLSPELPQDDERRGPPPKSVRVIVPDFQVDDLP